MDFDLREIEGFRYRVEDVSRAVTKAAVKETRAAEIRAEILNSDRLQQHFEDNPSDLQLLRHDRLATHVSKVQDHLKHVPKYLLPRGMQVADLNRKRKRKKTRKYNKKQSSSKDPLQSLSDGIDLDGLDGNDENEAQDMPNFDQSEYDDGNHNVKRPKREDSPKASKKIFSNTKGLGKSSAGRNAWKEKHRKGRFSTKKRLKDRKNKDPLGI